MNTVLHKILRMPRPIAPHPAPPPTTQRRRRPGGRRSGALVPAGSGWVIEGAEAINDLGQIAGSGTTGPELTNGVPEHALLLTPVVLTPPAPPQAPGGLAVKFVSLHELDLTWSDN